MALVAAVELSGWTSRGSCKCTGLSVAVQLLQHEAVSRARLLLLEQVSGRCVLGSEVGFRQ